MGIETDNAVIRHAVADMARVPTASHMKTAPESLTGQIAEMAKDHLKHRLNPLTIIGECWNHFCHKVLPQGADEMANVLYSSSAYLPWPARNGPAPIAPPEPETVPTLYGVGSDFDRDLTAYAAQLPANSRQNEMEL